MENDPCIATVKTDIYNGGVGIVANTNLLTRRSHTSPNHLSRQSDYLCHTNDKTFISVYIFIYFSCSNGQKKYADFILYPWKSSAFSEINECLVL